jgi:hypothetical protein
MRTLEAAVPLGLAGDQLGRERLLAVRAHDLVRGVRCGDVRHLVHGTCGRGTAGGKGVVFQTPASSELSSRAASSNTAVCASTSASVVAGDMSAML